jgi:hypothetical protein
MVRFAGWDAPPAWVTFMLAALLALPVAGFTLLAPELRRSRLATAGSRPPPQPAAQPALWPAGSLPLTARPARLHPS